MSKTGIIVEGGGMKCAYSAGVLDAFLDAGIHFDYAIGVSAGAANTASFLAGQRDRNRRFYVEHMSEPDYMSFHSYLKNGEFFNLHYIYGDLTNEGGGDPLDYDAMVQNPTQFEYPATDAETGKPHYFTKEDCKPKDYRPIMATCCLPVLCRPIEFEGRYYFDGGVTDSIPIARAKKQGCDRIVAVLSKPYDFVKEPEAHKFIYTQMLRRKFPNMVRALDDRDVMYNHELDELHKMEKAGAAMLYNPSGTIPMSTTGKDAAANQKLYEEGYQHGIERMDALKEFLG